MKYTKYGITIKHLTEEDIELLRYIKKITQDERNTMVRKARKENN